MSTAQIDEIASMQTRLNQPTLEGLSYALRHPETWPERFAWNYNDNCNCALGLMQQMWRKDKEAPHSGPAWFSMACRELALPFEDSIQIFNNAGVKKDVRWLGLVKRDVPRARVTPEMVADEIDAYLARRRITCGSA